MALREFLVPLEGNQKDVGFVQSCLKLADAVDGRVASVFGQIDPIEMLAWPSEGTFATGTAAMMEAAKNGNDEAWGAVQSRILEIAKINARLSLERIVGHPDVQIAKRGTLCDVAIFSCESARGKTGVSTIFTALLMDAYAPVMVLRGDPIPPLNVVAIAWDGGLEASRAAKSALMFLKAAKQVVIIQALDGLNDVDQSLTDPTRLNDWLARHGVRASVELCGATNDAASDILETCATHGVDLLVCGAFGHSRAREFIFGGVTRSLLKATSSPSLFLSH